MSENVMARRGFVGQGSSSPGGGLGWAVSGGLGLGLMLVPLLVWLGWAEATGFSNWIIPLGDPQVEGLVMVLSGTLMVAPFLWAVRSGRLDVAGLALAQNGLVMVGYFFLEETAGRQGGIGYDTARYAGLLVMLNAVGFAVLLSVMTVVYVSAGRNGVGGLRLPSDERLIVLLRAVGLMCAVVLLLPMVQSRTIPLLAENAAVARYQMVESSWVRPLYHFGSALLPMTVAGLGVWIVRAPHRVLGWDGVCCLLMLGAQFLTSNRLPLALTLVATLALLSMEMRWPRWLVGVVFLVYVGAFSFLSGLTSLLRQEGGIPQVHSVLQDSMAEAFKGDNLIDLRDGSWVLSQWDFETWKGRTYWGGLVSFLPSGLFPLKKEWHLGQNALAVVGWEGEEHFGLRLTFFAESFLNFGLLGVVILGAVLGGCFGGLLAKIHDPPPGREKSLARNLALVVTMQMLLPLANTSDAFLSWAMGGLLVVMGLVVWWPAQRESGEKETRAGVGWPP
ncbi:MAG: hypothetical protein SNJ84_09910 [Verrucomicrobiia bacterium]